MSSYNPYLDPDADADVFRSPEQEEKKTSAPITLRHSYDGSECPVCHVTHDVTVDPNAPAEIYAALDQILDTMPDEAKVGKVIVTDGAVPAGHIYTEVMERMSVLDNVVPVGPILRALCDIVASMGAGEKLGEMITFYEAEQKVLIKQAQLGMASHVLSNIESARKQAGSDAVPHSVAMLTDLMNTTIEGLRGGLDDTVASYCKLADQLGVETDARVVENDYPTGDSVPDLTEKLMRYFAILKSVGD